jgi:hypothetical protein
MSSSLVGEIQRYHGNYIVSRFDSYDFSKGHGQEDENVRMG